MRKIIPMRLLWEGFLINNDFKTIQIEGMNGLLKGEKYAVVRIVHLSQCDVSLIVNTCKGTKLIG